MKARSRHAVRSERRLSSATPRLFVSTALVSAMFCLAMFGAAGCKGTDSVTNSGGGPGEDPIATAASSSAPLNDGGPGGGTDAEAPPSSAASSNVDTPSATDDITSSGPTRDADDANSGSGRPAPVTVCESYAVAPATEARWDFELEPWVTLSGALSVKGELLPDADLWRGHLEFRDRRGNVTDYLIESSGSTYQLALPRGDYEIDFVPDPTCDDTAPFMPCSSGYLVKNVHLTEDTALDIEFPVVDIAATVTLAGGALPEQPTGRGGLMFIDSVTRQPGPRFVGLGTTGPATFHKRLLPGHYDIFYSTGSACDAAGLPCNSGWIAKDLDLTKSQVLVIDIPKVTVSGRITLDGAPLPDDGAIHGGMRLVASEPATAGEQLPEEAYTEVTDADGYLFTVLPGTYDLHFVGDHQGCLYVDNPQVPCVGGRVHQRVNLTEDTDLPVDLHGVTITGSVTLSGGSYLFAGGSLEFVNHDGEANTTEQLNPAALDAPADFGFRVLPGTYDIRYKAPLAACLNVSSPPQVPCNDGILAKDVALTSDQVLELDVPVAKISGAVTLNGAPLPDSTLARGPLYFLRAGETFDAALSLRTMPLGTTGPASYLLSLWPGEYDVWFRNSDNCSGQTPAFDQPCTGGLITSLSIAESQGLDLDVTALPVRGTLTEQGALVSADNSGVIAIGALGLPWGTDYTSVEVAADGGYELLLIPGDYQARGFGALPCEVDSYPAGSCGYYASSECPIPDVEPTPLEWRPPAQPGTLPPEEPPVVEEQDAGPAAPDGLALVQACDDAVGHAVECTAGTSEESAYALYRSSFCVYSMASRYEGCDRAQQIVDEAEQCRTSECDAATSCASVILSRLAFCLQ